MKTGMALSLLTFVVLGGCGWYAFICGTCIALYLYYLKKMGTRAICVYLISFFLNNMSVSDEAALARLLLENKHGNLSHNPVTRCFERTYSNGRRMRRFSPLTHNLKRAFYASHKRVRWTGGSSTRELGSAFHRHVFHQATCRNGECVCLSEFGRTPATEVVGEKMGKALAQRAAFLADYKLKPLASEVVVVSESTGAGTQVDELAQQRVRVGDTYHDVLWLISWKTGYKNATREPYRKRGKYLNTRLCPRPLATEENKHFLQLMAEKRMLQEMGVVPDVCVIVYVLRKARQYVMRRRLDSFWADPSAEEKCWSEFKRYATKKISHRCYAQKAQKWVRVSLG